LFCNFKVTYVCVTFKLRILQRKIEHTWFFNQPPKAVRNYLIRPELLEKWLMKNDFLPEVGDKFRFIANSGKIIYCQVSEVIPVSELSYTWHANSAAGNTNFNTEVVWTIVPKKNGTELRLVHDGFTVLEDYSGHDKGWTILGDRFNELLNAIKI
jgi:uncharacterized protein YndB with AHSA1/START domain